MPNHVSIRRHFKSNKLVLSFQFYKEYQTGTEWLKATTVADATEDLYSHY